MVVDLSPSSAKASAPTQPKFADSGVTSGHRIFTMIAPDGTTTFTPSYYNTTEHSNLNTTKGFRIKCYNSLTTEGVRFNPSTSDFTNYHYFVLVYSDSATQHHFAKITEIMTEDLYGDAIEFAPKLGNEIPKGTKFLIIKGPHKTNQSDIAAFSAGIKDDLKSDIHCARPLFYMFDENLDKKGELNHNTKYYCRQQTSNLITNPSAFNTTNAVTFRTTQDFGSVVIDYSKFSHSVTMTDKLQALDNTISGSITKNEGGTVTADTNDYNEMFPNARRIADDEVNSPVYSGPTRYLHYDYSPTKANLVTGIYEHNNTESMDGKGGFSETSILDSARILSKKIQEFYPYRVRHNIHRGNLEDFIALKATYASTNSTNSFAFNTEYDLSSVLNAGDEVKIDDSILIVDSFGSLSGGVQSVAFRAEVRAVSDGVFASATVSPSSGATLQRRAYNTQDGTLMIDLDLIGDRFSKMYVALSSLNQNGRFATVTACDDVKGMLTLSMSDDSYYGKTLSFATGNYLLFIERFNGEVENIESKKEEGQTVMVIQGRDKFNKLLSPVVNLNTLFSEDIIYSSNSPYNKLSQIDSTTLSIALGATTKATGIAVSAFDIVPTTGDKIFTVNGYIGEITSTSGDPLTINFTAALTEVNSEKIYIDTEKNYVLSKALGSSHLATARPSSLNGSANKGVVFTAGNEITMSSGVEGNALVGSSANTNEGAIGYSINSPSAISKDLPFQAKLHDEYGSASAATFDTVNTLMDFEVVNTNKKNNITEIELAPYLPITLGRKTAYFSETSELTFTSVGTVSAVDSATNDTYFDIANANAYALKLGEPLFVGDNKTFVGLVFDKQIFTTTGVLVRVFLDRTIYNFSTSDAIYKADNPIHDLLFVNGSHLWGGKIVTRPHPKLTSSGAVPLNVESTTIAGDYNSRFGQPYYKTRELGFGNFTLNSPIFKRSNNTRVPFYPRKSNLNTYISAYRFKPNIASSNINNFGKTDSSYSVIPPEERGLTGPYGSNASNVRIHQTADLAKNISSTIGEGLLETYERFNSIDESNARLFLYINTDLLPYSSLRKDSLMHSSGGNGTKTLTRYNLFLVNNTNIKDSSLESGERKLLKDSSFQTLSFNSEEDISTLKRFGLMRLTELCVDFLFNPVNPEKTIDDRLSKSLGGTLSIHGISITSGDTIDTISGTDIEFDGSITLSNGDVLIDEKGNLIGTVSNGGSVTGTSHTLSSNAFLTNDGSAPTRADISVLSAGVFLKGRNQKDTFHQLERFNFHPLKCCIIPVGSTYGNDSTDAGYVANSGALSLPANTEIVLPIAFESTMYSTLSSAAEGFAVRALGDFFTNIHGKVYNGLVGVVLDRFSIENGGRYEAEAGNTTQVLKNAGSGLEITVGTDEHLIVGSDHHFKGFDYPSDTSASYTTSAPYAADGAMMVFKPRLWVQSASTANFSTSTITSSNGNLHKNVIDVETTDKYNCFLKYIDLTGCYLVPEAGKDIVGTTVTTGTATTLKNMTNVRTSQLVHVVAHEISNSNKKDHHLICDKALSGDTAYRILQPNETCFYDFMPKEIHLNTLKPQYTKKANKREVYGDAKNSYFYKEGNDKEGNVSHKDEAVLSMFVAVDVDKQSSDDDIVIEDSNEFFTSILPEGDYSLYYSDGDNSKKIQTTSKPVISTLGALVLSDMFNAKGVVSVSETFTVSSNQELKITPTRACIGSTVSIGLEGEDLINELLEEEGIEFEVALDANKTPMYLAPNYQGVDLFSAIRYVLDRKEMKLVEENNVFKIAPDDDNDYYTGITIDDSGDFLIFEFEKVSTLFDFYNEINVYGNAHKATRKDIRSIQKRGRKTLEVVDGSLLTQQEVDKKALKLLRMHSTLNQKLTITLNSKGISQLRVGDIVNVSIPRENIEMSQYIVLEMGHELTGFITLQLGRYSKDLSDVFSELLISSKETKAALRNQDLTTNSFGFDFLESVKIKELKLLIRTRTASGGFLFGFTTALNTASTAFGSGGAISHTTLLDEDLV